MVVIGIVKFIGNALIHRTFFSKPWGGVRYFLPLITPCSRSMGNGKMMVEFFSAAMVVSVWRYRSCKAAGDSEITMEASLRALEAFISPSAAIT